MRFNHEQDEDFVTTKCHGLILSYPPTNPLQLPSKQCLDLNNAKVVSVRQNLPLTSSQH